MAALQAAVFLSGPVALAQAPSAASTPGAPADSSSVAPAEPAAPAPQSDADRMLDESLDLIEREYFDSGVTREELVEAAVRGMVDHLNRRAQRSGQPAVNAVLSRRDMSRLTDSMAGRVTGIGVLAKPSSAGIDVLQVFDGSPAGRAGLRPGDRIAAVNDVQVVGGGADAFSLLRGEDGTPVRLTVVREAGTSRETNVELKLVRGRYTVSAVSARMLDDDVGYVRISTFTRGSADDVAGNILALRDQGAWGLIVDLRGNPGGSLDEATRIAGMFIEPGRPLLQIHGREGAQPVTAAGEVLWNGPSPVTVLVDGGTASAAEALASALQTNERALLVGERTAGRGLGESIFPLPGGGAMRIATARFADAYGGTWIARGLTPDSPIHGAALDPVEDPQLRAALTIMARFRGRPANVNLADDGALLPLR